MDHLTRGSKDHQRGPCLSYYLGPVHIEDASSSGRYPLLDRPIPVPMLGYSRDEVLCEVVYFSAGGNQQSRGLCLVQLFITRVHVERPLP
jgi:hypothetical protein